MRNPPLRPRVPSPVAPALPALTGPDVLVNAFLLGTDFAIMHSYGPVFLLAGLALLTMAVLFNRRDGTGLPLGLIHFNWVARLGLALLVLNVAIMAGQNVYIDGIKAGIKVLLQESVFLGILVIVVWRFLPRALLPTLVTSALAMVWFGFLNLVADRVGIGFESLIDRTTYFTSHFNEGGFRWQAPLYSSWQISGLLRWAVPLLGVALILSRRRWLDMAVLSLGLAVGIWVSLRCEYRAALFPAGGAVLWVLLLRNGARAGFSILCYVYALVVPFLITHDNAARFLQENLPGFVLRIAGDQDLLGVLTLSGRSTMWDGGLDVLAEGRYFWIGQGHVLMNAVNDIGGQDASGAQLFSRLGYHQGMLDIVFIYGVVPGAVLILSLLALMGAGAVETFRLPRDSFRAQELSFALFSLGMVALSNCHDGFFLEHNWFYFLCILSCCAIANGIVPESIGPEEGPR